MVACKPSQHAGSARLGTGLHHLWCPRPAWNYATGQAYWNEDGILSDHSSPNCCFAEGPRSSCQFAARAMPFFARHHRTTGAGLRGLVLTSAPGVCAWATPFCPFLAKRGGSRWDRVAIYFFLPVRSYRRSIWVSVLASNLLAQRVQQAAPPVGESFSPGTTELNFQPHESAIRSSLQTNAQTFFTQQRRCTY